MKRDCRFINFPTQLWENQQLSWMAKIVLMEIDSYPRSELGVNVRAGAVATALGITKKECDAALKELFDKGAIQVNIDEGQKLLLPLIYKSEYVAKGQPVVEGKKPTTSNSIDYDEVAKQWREICSMLPPIQRWTPQRKNKLRACLNQAELTIGDIPRIFRLVSTSNFLNGTSSCDWRCSFDWLIKSASNITKVYEGNYHRDYSERKAYELIMGGGEIQTENSEYDTYYR